jgi:hypothetical protein
MNEITDSPDSNINHEDNFFTGEIKVASRIVDYLSSGLYHSPAACLKELINNAYDADATEVKVSVKPDGDLIVIQDNGNGMNKDEFVRHFERISESHKRDVSSITGLKRPKIGKIGIGFIAANELCEVMEILSTKAGSRELLHITINFSEMRKPPEERRRNSDAFIKADYVGEILEAAPDDHYTHIFLEEIRGGAKEVLVSAKSQAPEKLTMSLYGKSAEGVVKALKNPDLNSWKDFDFYSETMLQVALNIPIEYAEGWMPDHLKSKVKEFEQEVSKLNFKVNYDGTPLRKPIVFSPDDKSSLIQPFVFKGKYVSAKGYFYAQHGTVKPQDLHGLLIRIRNAAVAEFDSSFWGFTPSLMQIIQKWVSAEIWADDGLEEAMNIDRRTLREAHPAYIELRDEIHKQLKIVFESAKKNLYEIGNKERRADKATETQKKIETALRTVKLSANARNNMVKQWEKQAEKPSVQKSLLKKYSVDELYSIILEVAEDVMTPDQLETFLRRLTDRLGK